MIGLRRGDAVVVHASLREVGLDADEVIDSLLDAVGPEGLVVMPTFTYDNETFTLDTPGRTGALAETFRRRPGALRSSHPDQSVRAKAVSMSRVKRSLSLRRMGKRMKPAGVPSS